MLKILHWNKSNSYLFIYNEDFQKAIVARKNLHYLSKTIYMEKKMGKKLG